MMILYPDIEIQGGRSVSLPRGRKEEPLVFAISPLQAAEDFENAGAEWLHVIDIDGVFQGGRHNAELILEIIQNADIPIQVGGGIRTERDVEWWLERGVKRVVLGTAAIKDLNLLKRVCYQHPESIVVSIDVRGGYVLVDGWQTQTSFQPIDLCNSFENLGVAAVIYTDIDRFENHPESSLAGTTEMGTALSLPIISSGMIHGLDDISLVRFLPNIHGAIVGKALFTGAVDLKEAIAIARGLGVDPSLAEEGVKPGPTSDTRFLPEPHRPLSYKTLGQELLDLHQTHIKGLISEKEYEIAKFSILRKLKE
jgi:phosphoribosylformimino-5-aminoimidazole carboxamide ribotide isomerase